MRKTMRRCTSQDPDFEAWVEVPDAWLSGDYDTYIRAYAEAQVHDHAHPTCRLAGVLALILKGRVRANVPGLELRGELDLGAINALAMGFLLNTVALPLEMTQAVPFGFAAPSGNGTQAATT